MWGSTQVLGWRSAERRSGRSLFSVKYAPSHFLSPHHFCIPLWRRSHDSYNFNSKAISLGHGFGYGTFLATIYFSIAWWRWSLPLGMRGSIKSMIALRDWFVDLEKSRSLRFWHFQPPYFPESYRVLPQT
jgi:hypothetical protein